MARIVGVDIPNEKVTWVALTYVHGIGKKTAFDILEAVGVNPQRRVKDLTDDELARITTEIEKNYVVEGNLRRQVQQNISRLKEIACYRGIRHRRGLPGPWPAHPDQRPHPEGPAQDGGRQEERGLRNSDRRARAHRGLPRWFGGFPWATPVPKVVEGSGSATLKVSSTTPPSNPVVVFEIPRGARDPVGQEAAWRARRRFVGTCRAPSCTRAGFVQQHDRHLHRPQLGDPLLDSAGTIGFKGRRKSTPFAAQRAAERAAEKALKMGVREVDARVKGPGTGRESAILQPPGPWPQDPRHRGRHAAAAQRLPSPQAPPRLAPSTVPSGPGPAPVAVPAPAATGVSYLTWLGLSVRSAASAAAKACSSSSR